MSDGYEYDIFLSFCRKGNAGDWVTNHFHPLLERCLCDECSEEPDIFFYPEQQTGAIWPQNLAYSLKRSRLLVAVWSPPYFRSRWCMFEWQSMLARERMLGLRTEEKPWGLVYPVIFSDGEHFHPDACVTQARKDLSPWAIPHKVFERSVEYVEFHRHMGRIAVELAQLIHDVPQWDPEFPVIQEPDISPAVIAHIPRVL